MAILKIGITVYGNKKEYQALTTDLISSYPIDCGAGSTLITVDTLTHTLGNSYYFDGTNWNEV